MKEIAAIYKKNEINDDRSFVFPIENNNDVTVLTLRNILETISGLKKSQQQMLLANFIKIQNDKKRIIDYTYRIGLIILSIKL